MVELLSGWFNEPTFDHAVFYWSSNHASKTRMIRLLQRHAVTKLRYNDGVRRILSITLLVLFSLPLIAPVLALAAGPGVNLPACCRRSGAHHCMLKMQTAESSGAGVSLSAIPQRCPAYPAVVTQAKHGDLSFHAASLIFAELVSHPSVKTQTQARARVALDRSRQKRGPPSNLL
jgi:hypothetical protein